MALFGKRELLIATLLISLVLASLYAAGLSAELSALRDQARRLQTCTKDENGKCAQQDEPEESDEAGGLVARVMSGGLVLFCCVAPSLAVRVLRAMPAVAQESRDGSSSGGAGEGKLKQYSRLDVVRYRLEYWFSTSAFSKPLALLLMTVWLALLGAGFLYAFTGAAWRVVLWRAVAVLGLDWTPAAGEDSETEATFVQRMCGLVLAVAGTVVTALLVSIISDLFSEKMDELRRGGGDVMETRHTLILGWNDKVLGLIRQIALANKSEGGGAVVVLASMDKEEMDSQVADGVPPEDAMGTRVICRSGSPLLAIELARVSAANARAIVLLTGADSHSNTNADETDAMTLRVILALSRLRDLEGLRGHLCAEVCAIDNVPLMRASGGDFLHPLVSHDIIGRLMLQCARQPGLAPSYEDLLGFQGNTFYRNEWPSLVGRSFAEVVTMFPEAIPVGVVVNGQSILNPPDSFVLQHGDAIYVVAEDNDAYSPSAAPALLGDDVDELAPTMDVNSTEEGTEPKPPDRVLIIGWREELHALILALDEYVPRGSDLFILSDMSLEDRDQAFAAANFSPIRDLTHLKITHVVGEQTNKKTLEGLPLERMTSALSLAGGSDGDAASDCRTVATLLNMRAIQAERAKGDKYASMAASNGGDRTPQSDALVRHPDEKRSLMANYRMAAWRKSLRNAAASCAVVAEILDSRSEPLIADMALCDYVLTTELVSRTLALVAEDPRIDDVLTELFSANGCNMCIMPASTYVRPGETLSFWQLSRRARARQHVVLGIRCAAAAASSHNAVEESGHGSTWGGHTKPRHVLNPPNKAAPLLWQAGDSVVVLATRGARKKR